MCCSPWWTFKARIQEGPLGRSHPSPEEEGFPKTGSGSPWVCLGALHGTEKNRHPQALRPAQLSAAPFPTVWGRTGPSSSSLRVRSRLDQPSASLPTSSHPSACWGGGGDKPRGLPGGGAPRTPGCFCFFLLGPGWTRAAKVRREALRGFEADSKILPANLHFKNGNFFLVICKGPFTREGRRKTVLSVFSLPLKHLERVFQVSPCLFQAPPPTSLSKTTFEDFPDPWVP